MTGPGDRPRVLLGVTGCIAAYRAPEIVRRLRETGVVVEVAMTRHAAEFITPLTLETVSGHPVLRDQFAEPQHAGIPHIEAGKRIQALCVAPATANCLGKLAHGIADDFLSTLYLSTAAPVLLAPAMNPRMWDHPATRANVEALRARGVRFIEPESGALACGEVGEGRLAEVERIVAAVRAVLPPAAADPPAAPPLAGRRVVVTAGPTCEDLDGVRFLTNRSTGKMGFALAEEAARLGATVTVIAGPTPAPSPAGVPVRPVRSAEEMTAAVLEALEDGSILVMAAAVADYRPAQPVPGKWKKTEAPRTLELVRTPDVLEQVAQARQDRGLRLAVVGFAAEAEELEDRMREKLTRKGMDLVVGNRLNGVAGDETQLTLFAPASGFHRLPALAKPAAAAEVWQWVLRECPTIPPR